MNCSMGTVLPLLDKGYIRFAYPNSVLMFHGSNYYSDGDLKSFESLHDLNIRCDKLIDKSIMETVGLTDKQYKKYSSYDNYFYAEDILNVGEHGFLDGIIIKEFEGDKYHIKTREGIKLFDFNIHEKEDIKLLPIIPAE